MADKRKDEKKKMEDCSKPPLEVDEKTRARWSREAVKWARKTRKKVPQGDMPPGRDPDDKHKYVFPLPVK